MFIPRGLCAQNVDILSFTFKILFKENKSNHIILIVKARLINSLVQSIPKVNEKISDFWLNKQKSFLQIEEMKC